MGRMRRVISQRGILLALGIYLVTVQGLTRSDYRLEEKHEEVIKPRLEKTSTLSKASLENSVLRTFREESDEKKEINDQHEKDLGDGNTVVLKPIIERKAKNYKIINQHVLNPLAKLSKTLQIFGMKVQDTPHYHRKPQTNIDNKLHKGETKDLANQLRGGVEPGNKTNSFENRADDGRKNSLGTSEFKLLGSDSQNRGLESQLREGITENKTISSENRATEEYSRVTSKFKLNRSEQNKSFSDIIKHGSSILSKIRVMENARDLYKALASESTNPKSETIISKVKALENSWKTNVVNFTKNSRSVLSKISSIGNELQNQIKTSLVHHILSHAQTLSPPRQKLASSAQNKSEENVARDVKNISSKHLHGHNNNKHRHHAGHNLQKKSYYGNEYDDGDDYSDDDYDDYNDETRFSEGQQPIRNVYNQEIVHHDLDTPQDYWDDGRGVTGYRQENAATREFHDQDDDSYDEPEEFDNEEHYDDQYDDYDDDRYDEEEHYRHKTRPRYGKPQHQLRVTLEAQENNSLGNIFTPSARKQNKGDTRELKTENSDQAPSKTQSVTPPVQSPPIQDPSVPDPPPVMPEPPAAILQPPPDPPNPDPPSVIFVPPQKVSIFPSKTAAAFSRSYPNPNMKGNDVNPNRVASISVSRERQPITSPYRRIRNIFRPSIRQQFRRPHRRFFPRHSEMSLTPSFELSSYREEGAKRHSLTPDAPLETPSFELSSYREEGAKRHSFTPDISLETSFKTSSYPEESARSNSLPPETFVEKQESDISLGQDWSRKTPYVNERIPDSEYLNRGFDRLNMGWNQVRSSIADQKKEQQEEIALASRLLQFSADMDQKNFGLS